jgi:hypothetical protein
MAAWLYLPPLILLSVIAITRGARRAGLLMMVCGPLLLYGAALAAFKNTWTDPSFPETAARDSGAQR